MYIPPNNAMATMIHMKPQFPYRDISALPDTATNRIEEYSNISQELRK